MARLPDEYINSVVRATDIVALINEFTPLTKAGAEYRGLCPFHADKSPSMNVNGEKGLYLCRSCGATGNAINFVANHENLPFLDVVTELAKRAALPSPDQVRGRNPEESGRYNQLMSAVARAEQLFQHALSEFAIAQEYLRNRGITPEMANNFGIGYAPSGRRFLQQNMRDFSEEVMIEAGLLKRSAYEEGKVIDFMDGRIIFPIRNSAGRTVAFGGRRIDEGTERKYLNTPETPIFKKGSELFGLSHAMREVGRDKSRPKTLICTEGYFDVVVPHGHGIRNVASVMGVAIQPAMIERVFKSADVLAFCFDGDEAGRTAAFRAMEIAAPFVNEKKTCRFAFLPAGKDPDDFVREEGPAAFASFIDKSEPLSKYMIRVFKDRHDMDSVEGMAAFAADCMQVVEKITSPTVKGLMTRLVESTIGAGIPLPGVTEGVPAVVPTPPPPPPPSRSAFARRLAPRPDTPGAPPAEAKTGKDEDSTSIPLRVLGLLMREPMAAQHFESSWFVATDGFPVPEADAVGAVIDFTKTLAESEMHSVRIREHFRGSQIEGFIEAAMGQEAKRVQLDPVGQLNGFVQALIEQAEASNKRRRAAP